MDFDTVRAASRALTNVPVHTFVHASNETAVAAGELSKIGRKKRPKILVSEIRLFLARARDVEGCQMP